MAKIVLIGAGSKQFGFETLGDIFQSGPLTGSEIVLVDINKSALKEAADQAELFVKEHSLPYTVKASIDRKDALKGADFVVVSIEVGDRFALWDQDRTVPQQYGIRQVFGENGGPGGLFHSLRIIPPILEICKDVLALCPDAFVFNFSNPMSRICTAVQNTFPDLRFIGLCHEIFSLERYLPKLLSVDFSDLSLYAGGLNHFSCLLTASYRSSGKDAYPDILSKAEAFFSPLPGSTDYLAHLKEKGKLPETEGAAAIDFSVLKASRRWCERKLFKFMIDNFDLLPVTTDSHFGEYLPWAYDTVDHKGILDFYRYYQLLLQRQKPGIVLRRRERSIAIMESLLTGEAFREQAVNILNKGYIAELPVNISVEVPAVIKKDSIEGIEAPKIPAGFAGLLQNQVGVHLMTAEAAVTGSKKAALQALLVDPVVDRCANVKELLEVMIDLQKEYLGYLK